MKVSVALCTYNGERYIREQIESILQKERSDRAGIGISERTDAVAAIVSEETGGLSVAVGGMLKRHLTPDTFEKILRSELLPRENREAKGLRRIFAGGGKKHD